MFDVTTQFYKDVQAVTIAMHCQGGHAYLRFWDRSVTVQTPFMNLKLTDAENDQEDQVDNQFSECRLDMHLSVGPSVFCLPSSPQG